MDVVRILVAEADDAVRERLAAALREAGHEVQRASSGEKAVRIARTGGLDLLFLGEVAGSGTGASLLQEIKRATPATLVVACASSPTTENVLAAFRAGAYDVLVHPVLPETALELAGRASELRRRGERRRRLAEELSCERMRVLELKRQLGVDDPFRRVLGSSDVMRRLVETLREVARTDSTVLITGESGTGKGLVARVLHDASPRAEGPFVEANCVVYSETLLHSELFGHERGAFTGAARLKRGRFELAKGGSLFLDEIGEISPATQLLLLRILQDRTYERVGGERTLEADVRLLAATNRDLSEAIRRGAFRSDLFYRLNVIPIHLPPLREHLEDVPLLAQEFLRTRAKRLGREIEGFSTGVLGALTGYSWPGNVRELDNLVERLVVLCRGRTVEWSDLPDAIRSAGGGAPVPVRQGTLQDLERERIRQVLRECGGNKKAAARKLGIHRSTLYDKIRKYGLDDGETPSRRPARSERAAG